MRLMSWVWFLLMGSLRRRRRSFLFAALAIFALFHVFVVVFADSAESELTRSVVKPGGWLGQRTGSDLPGRFTGTKMFGGPGSSPPTCRSKCGKCQPCEPFNMPIEPGMSMPLEYYPEVWRCKCGNRLYMP